MSLSQLQQIGDIPFQIDSPVNAADGTGSIYVRDVEVNKDYIGTLDFYIYDLNGPTDSTGEPFLVNQGTTSVSQEGDQFFIYIESAINLSGDPSSGSVSFEIQFQDQDDPLQPNFVVSRSISLEEQESLFQTLMDDSGPTHEKQSHGKVEIFDNGDTLVFTDEKEYLGIVDDTPSIDPDTPTLDPSIIPALPPVFEPIVGFSAEAHAQSLSWFIFNDLGGETRLLSSAATSSVLTIIGVSILLLPVLIRTWRDFNEKSAK